MSPDLRPTTDEIVVGLSERDLRELVLGIIRFGGYLRAIAALERAALVCRALLDSKLLVNPLGPDQRRALVEVERESLAARDDLRGLTP